MAEAYLPYRGCGAQAKSIANAEVALDFSSVTYDGSDHAPAEQSVTLHGAELQLNRDYVYAAVRHRDAGSYTVKVMGIRKYGGVKEVPWQIEKARGTIRFEPARVKIEGGVGTTATVNVLCESDGAISVSRSQCVRSEVAGKQITLASVSEGSDTLTVTLGDGTNHTGASAQLQVEVNLVRIWGVKWDGQPGTKWIRTDEAANFVDPVPYYNGMDGTPSSPFDGIPIWDRIADTIDDLKLGKVGQLTKYWYELKPYGDGGLSIRIAEEAMSGFVPDPIHMSLGPTEPEVDTVLVGCYHCASDTRKSETGKDQWSFVTYSDCSRIIQALDEHTYMLDFATRFTLWMLYLVEFADWNSECIGYGCSTSRSLMPNGQTDNLPYHTGTTANRPNEYGFTKWRNIEGLWDNVMDWMGGVYYSTEGMYILLDPTQTGNTSGGVLVGKPSAGNPSKFAVSETSPYPVFYPVESRGTESTYTCDSWNFNETDPCLYAGGSFIQSRNYGMFGIGCGMAIDMLPVIGGRLIKRVPSGGT